MEKLRSCQIRDLTKCNTGCHTELVKMDSPQYKLIPVAQFDNYPKVRQDPLLPCKLLHS